MPELPRCPHSDGNSCEQYRLQGMWCQDCPLIRPREFDCAECGRHIFSSGYNPKPGTCLTCQHLPGWHKDPYLRSKLDPGGPDA